MAKYNCSCGEPAFAVICGEEGFPVCFDHFFKQIKEDVEYNLKQAVGNTERFQIHCFFKNDEPIYLPFASYLQLGEKDVYKRQIPSRRLIKRSFNARLSDVVAGSGPSGSFRPSDMRAAYYGSGTLTGTGQSVGMLEFDGYNIADVNSDMGGVAYTVPVQNILVDGASAGSDGDDGEQALDIAQAIGMAPGLTSVRVYIAPGNSAIGTGDVDIFNQMAVDNISKQLSCSWGWSPDDITDDDPIFKEFAAQGQNLFVASGDAGKYTGNNNNDSSYPAEDPYVVAVGGTDLTTNGAGGTWQTETAWSDSSGGPADDGFAIPSWQVGVANSNGASTAIRNVPDVAAEANFDNIMCDDGACTCLLYTS